MWMLIAIALAPVTQMLFVVQPLPTREICEKIVADIKADQELWVLDDGVRITQKEVFCRRISKSPQPRIKTRKEEQGRHQATPTKA